MSSSMISSPDSGQGTTRNNGNHLLPGTRLGEFEIREVLGEGGFAVVYLAFDHSLHRTIAIKEYMPAMLALRHDSQQIYVRSGRSADAFSAGLRSFVNEARMLAQFDHPALIKVYRFWEENGTAYMVMPYYIGQTLKQILASHPEHINEMQLTRLLLPLFGALDVLHQSNCFHRDISLDNIIVQKDDTPILLDFGAARKIISDIVYDITVVLKPVFAPIEQYMDDRTLQQGAWTDVYALGAVLHNLLLGAPPPPAITRIIKDEYISLLLREEISGYSNRFLGAIDAALQLHPQDRPQSIAQFAALMGIRSRPKDFGVYYLEAAAAREINERQAAKSVVKLPSISDVPATPAPEPPITELPVTEPPITEPPITELPITELPITELPITESPITESPVIQQPSVMPDSPAKITQQTAAVPNLPEQGSMRRLEREEPQPPAGQDSTKEQASQRLALLDLVLFKLRKLADTYFPSYDNKIILWVCATVLCTLVLVSTAIFIFSRIDEQAWINANIIDTAAAYQQYIDKHSLGKYSEQAKVKYEKARVWENDKHDWEQAKRANTFVAYQQYIDKHSTDSGHLEDAKNMRRKAQEREEVQAQKEQDERAWNDAKNSDTAAAYQQYIDTFPPNGKYLVEAIKAHRKAIETEKQMAEDKRDWDDAKRRNNCAGYERYIKKHFLNGKYLEDATLALKQLMCDPTS